MKTHVEFRSDKFPAYPGEDEEVNPGIWGRRLAEFIAAGLRNRGLATREPGAEDWGWIVEIENESFPLWIGCANYEEYPDGFVLRRAEQAVRAALLKEDFDGSADTGSHASSGLITQFRAIDSRHTMVDRTRVQRTRSQITPRRRCAMTHGLSTYVNKLYGYIFMKNAKNIVVMFAMSAFAALTCFAQAPDKPANPKYDAELAKKVGADDYGMRNYVFCILKTGPKDASITDKKQRDEIFAGHMANIQRLADEGKLALAGPFGKNDRTYRGLFIFSVATVDEAQKLVDTDPVIKSGMMTAELTPWYGSAATMLVNENHKKVMKKSF